MHQSWKRIRLCENGNGRGKIRPGGVENRGVQIVDTMEVPVVESVPKYLYSCHLHKVTEVGPRPFAFRRLTQIDHGAQVQSSQRVGTRLSHRVDGVSAVQEVGPNGPTSCHWQISDITQVEGSLDVEARRPPNY
ncbi:hypothetical protein A5695_20245 [Mycobacterium sp. E1747]|nr:hypothetical protein A5695_20245 [Mycobacterium sp. E1747]